MMKLYNQQHAFYCGVDLHAKTLHVCVVDDQGEKRLHRNFQCQHDRSSVLLGHVLAACITWSDLLLIGNDHPQRALIDV